MKRSCVTWYRCSLLAEVEKCVNSTDSNYKQNAAAITIKNEAPDRRYSALHRMLLILGSIDEYMDEN